jgi:hypothetical protein
MLFLGLCPTPSALTLNPSPSPRDPQLGVPERGTLKGFLPFSQSWEKGPGDEGKPTGCQSDELLPLRLFGEAQFMNFLLPSAFSPLPS